VTGGPTRRDWAILAICWVALVLAGCGSLAQVRVGSDKLEQPRPATVLALLCLAPVEAEGEIGARRYLGGYAHLSQGRTDELVAEARIAKLRGGCECPTDGCAER
jgi:hypothetical protein